MSAIERIFIYGFGPYREFRTNITADIIQQFPSAPGILTRVFETKFDAEMILDELNRIRPNIVIGLGQTPRTDGIFLETTARNLMCVEREDLPKRIDVGGASELKLSLTLPLKEGCLISDDAGDYVCNFSMWTVESWCRVNQAKSTFIHIPFNYPISKAVSYIQGIIDTNLPIDFIG